MISLLEEFTLGVDDKLDPGAGARASCVIPSLVELANQRRTYTAFSSPSFCDQLLINA